MENINLKEQSENFFKLISLKQGEKEIIFDSGTHIGFSIKREYPENIGFSKIRKTSGENETKCLIRIGYKVEQVNENNEADLFIDAGLWHDILQNIDFHTDGNLKDIDFKSIEKFNSSRLPLKIHGSMNKKYIYNTQNHKFYTKKRRKEKSLREIVDDIFKTHVNSTKCYTFYKVKTIINSAQFILWFGEIIFYKLLLRIIGGVKFKDDTFIEFKANFGEKYNKKDFDKIEFKETKGKNIPIHEDDYDGTEIDLPFFSGKIKINKRGLLFSILVLAILALFNKCGYVISKFELYKNNEVILAVLGLFWIIVFHILFEYIIIDLSIYILNIFIKTYKWINSIISINGYDIEVYDNPFKKYSK